MLFAENFISLKMCESWTNIAKDLMTENIEPIGADSYNLIEKIQMIKQWKFYLQDQIDKIFQKKAQKVINYFAVLWINEYNHLYTGIFH